MIKSMTGFGKAEFENDNVKIEVQIKSLNSKVLDLKIKFPNIPAENELKIRNIISAEVSRGKIDCEIKLQPKGNEGKFKINDKIFDKYYKQFISLNKKYGTFVEEVNFYQILMNLPEVIESEEIEISEIWETIYNAVKEAVKNLNEFREQEGQATKKVFLNSIEAIKQHLNTVPNFENERIETMRQKLHKALKDNKLDIDNERFESEIIYYIEKFDINEEKVRLANHLKYFLETLEQENTGKKLNFITQEMGREINTMGSKANNFEIQKLVVAMKDELEKIKEQILNIL